jgi:GT2 family glycosyltransferase
MRSPRVIVLILSYNGKYLLEEAISSYLENDYGNFEVVVVDNGSRDGTAEFVNKKFPDVEVLRTEKNLGYAGGFNLGLDFAFNGRNGDYALVSNNDVKADSRMISELLRVAETDRQIGFVTGKVYYYGRINVLQTVGMREDPVRWRGDHIGNGEVDRGQYDEVCERCFADDVFTLVRRRLYADIGGYDPMFFLQSEETDWQARAKKLGYRIMYTPHAKLWHKAGMTIGRDSALKAYYDARNPMLVILIHKSPQFFKQFFWFHFRKEIFRSSLVYLKQGRLSPILAKWRGFFSGIEWGFRHKKFTMSHFI